ncbi:hypothetical protein MRX96_037398 [Rhipicephalus microplus]
MFAIFLTLLVRGVSGASAHVEFTGEIDAVTGSEKPPGGLKSGVEGASIDETPASKLNRLKQRRLSRALRTNSGVITLSEVQYTSLLHPHSLPNPLKAYHKPPAGDGPCYRTNL